MQEKCKCAFARLQMFQKYFSTPVSDIVMEFRYEDFTEFSVPIQLIYQNNLVLLFYLFKKWEFCVNLFFIYKLKYKNIYHY